MTELAQSILESRMRELNNLVETYPFYVPVLAAAELMRIKPEALRASIEQGRCPFGFCWTLGDRMAYKVPTVTFVNWFTKGTLACAY